MSRRAPSLPQLLALLAVAALALGAVVTRRLGRQRPAADPLVVRSTVRADGNSLAVTVRWTERGALASTSGDSLRVTVAVEGGAPVGVLAPRAAPDVTVRVAPPGAGSAIAGSSCVVAADDGGEERCTPWQFVRPSAAGDRHGLLAKIVVQPDGMQVDPDVGGRCAEWQRVHPGRSVWVAVNQQAIPPCTGPNGRPVVAQFCAFAEFPDGRRTQTANSQGIAYCERLFAEWSRQRYS